MRRVYLDCFGQTKSFFGRNIEVVPILMWVALYLQDIEEFGQASFWYVRLLGIPRQSPTKISFVELDILLDCVMIDSVYRVLISSFVWSRLIFP